MTPVPLHDVPGEAGPDGTPSTATAAGKGGRAGRNLPVAIAVGVGMGGLVLLSIFVRKEVFVALVAIFVVLGVRELATAFHGRHLQVPTLPLTVGAVAMLLAAWLAGTEALFVVLMFTAIAVAVWRVLDGVGTGAARDIAASVFTAAYLPLLASFAVLLLVPQDGPYRILAFVIVVVASDTGGYAVGVTTGRHLMAPSVSPKKSWEGMAGSVVCCAVAGSLAVPLLLGGPWWAGLLLGICAVASATVGDLAESMIKRDLGIKDMSTMLPGHGGVMDRLDSLLATAPLAYLILTVFIPVT